MKFCVIRIFWAQNQVKLWRIHEIWPPHDSEGEVSKQVFEVNPLISILS